MGSTRTMVIRHAFANNSKSVQGVLPGAVITLCGSQPDTDHRGVVHTPIMEFVSASIISRGVPPSSATSGLASHSLRIVNSNGPDGPGEHQLHSHRSAHIIGSLSPSLLGKCTTPTALQTCLRRKPITSIAVLDSAGYSYTVSSTPAATNMRTSFARYPRWRTRIGRPTPRWLRRAMATTSRRTPRSSAICRCHTKGPLNAAILSVCHAYFAHSQHFWQTAMGHSLDTSAIINQLPAAAERDDAGAGALLHKDQLSQQRHKLLLSDKQTILTQKPSPSGWLTDATPT